MSIREAVRESRESRGMVERSLMVRTAVFAAALAASVLLGACVAQQSVPAKKQDRGIKFSHEVHKDASCTDCHAVEDAAAAMPGHDQCGACHEINTEEVDEEKCAFCHSRPGAEVLPREALVSDELKFSHAAHEAKQIECSTCHPNPDAAPLKTGSLKPFCMDCHGKTSPKLNECAVCHSQVTRETIPQRRAGSRIAHDAPAVWENVHGRESIVDPAYCALCHDEQTSCDDCHQKNPPRDHTVSFKRRTHGMQAEWNRNKCAACHEEDSCRQCHKDTAPSSHRGGWGGHANTHCVQCHYPQEETKCAVCHEEIEHPSALPSPHILGVYPARCGLCHPGGVPFRAPHLTNSTVRCAACHR